MAITFNHNDKLYVSGSNVGIGTDSPTQKLDVSGNIVIPQGNFLSIRRSGVDNPILWQGNGTFGSADQLYLRQPNNNNLHLQTNGGNTRLLITGAGNVGIGTTSPTHMLDITTNKTGNGAGSTIRINRPDNSSYENAINWATGGTNKWFLGSDNDSTENFYLYNWAESVFALTVKSSNNYVGIGTTSPNAKLEIYDASAPEIIVNYLGNSVNGALWFNRGTQKKAGIVTTSEGAYSRKGLAFYTNDTGDYTTDATEKVRIDDSGNVGIGTTSPGARVHIKGTATGHELLRLEGGVADANPYISFYQTSTRRSFIQHNDANNNLIIASEYGLISFKTASDGSETERMRVTSAGNVGIGTTSPAEKLDVSGNAQVQGILKVTKSGENSRFNSADANGPYVSFRNNGTAKGYIGSGFHLWTSPNNLADNFGIRAENQLDFGIGASVKMTLDSSGNVGIGTTSPSSKLHIINSENASWSTTFQNTVNSYGHDVYTAYNNTATSTRYGLYISGTGTTTSDYHLLINTQFAVIGNGNVGIGTTSPASKLQIGSVGATNYSVPNGLAFGDGTRAAALNVESSGLNIYSSSHIKLSPNTTEQVRITTAGNVGIGTTSPSGKLTIKSPGDVDTYGDAFVLERAGTTAKLIRMYEDSADGFLEVRTGADAIVTKLSGYSGTPSYFLSNVGIGTSSPAQKLDVTNGNIQITNTAYKTQTEQVAGTLRFNLGGTTGERANPLGEIRGLDTYAGGGYQGDLSFHTLSGNVSNERMRIKSSGNVGIGTDSPTQKLDVSGNIVIPQGSFLSFRRSGFDNPILWQGNGTFGSADQLYLRQPNNNNLHFQTNGGNTRMLITGSGNVGIGTTTPGAKLDVEGLILSDQIQTKEYTSLTGSSGDWFPIGAITDQYTGPVRYSILTYAHSSIDFIVSEAYSLANTHNITVLNSNYGANGGFANVSAVRVRQDGGVEIKLVWSSGPSVQVRITARGTYGTPTLPSSLVTTTNTSTVIDTVDNGSGKMRTQKTLEVGSTVLLNYSGSSYLNGGNFGIGTTSPGAKLAVEVAGTADVIKFTRDAGANGEMTFDFSSANSNFYSNQGGFTFSGSSSSYGVNFTASGNVGIGTTVPSELLELDRDGKIGFGANGNYGIRTGYFDDSGGTHGFHIDTKHAGSWSDRRFVVRADSGNVGIGTDNPSYKFTVSSGTADIGILTASSDSGSYVGFLDNNTSVIPKIGAVGNKLVLDADNIGVGITSPSYQFQIDNDALNTNNPALYVRNPNSSSGAVIAEFVGDSDSIQIKNINVGDYAIYNTQQSNGIALYDGNGGVEIHYNGATVLEADSNGGIKVTGQISATGDVVAYSSDERLKENIKPIENAVDKIKQLKGVTFDWNEKSQELGFEPSTKTNDVGVIAQDVEAVFPQLVHLAPFDIGSDEEGKATSKTGEDYKTVNYARLTAVLIEAVKEQQQQIDELKEIINGFTK